MRIVLLFVTLLAVALPAAASAPAPIQVRVSFDPGVRSEPVTGRVFLVVARKEGIEPRLMIPFTFAYSFNDPSVPYVPLFGRDVEALAPGQATIIDATASGYPYQSLRDLPAGDYVVQAVLNVYTQFKRSDGHTLWAHADNGEGQQFHLSPGNLVSEPLKVRLDPAQGVNLALKLTRVIPPIEPAADTRYVKHVRFKSALISKFWGHDMWFSAIVVLPKGYDEHTDVKYPVVFHHGHFQEGAPLGFTEDEPKAPPEDAPPAAHEHYRKSKAFHDAWRGSELPRMILVSLQHPTPYYDDSYLANSRNNGPWADALFQEMLPLLEKKFRMIGKPYARVMVGASTGGWISAALQIHYPDQFGGAWSFCPDPVDFREFMNVDIYKDEQAFTVPGYEWIAPERFMSRSPKGQPRLTVRALSQMSAALGSRGRSAEFLDMWSAVYGPVDDDGYPALIWDHATGKINHEVAEYWRANNFDLRDYLARNWSTVGPRVADKLHFSCGDMDNFYLNLAMYRLEDFLKTAKNPQHTARFKWGRPMIGHEYFGYDPWPMALLEDMAEQMTHAAPAGDDPTRWRYR